MSAPGVDPAGGQSFGGQVGEGTDRGSFAGELGVGGGVGQPEVDQAREVVMAEQDVGRFDVTMDHRFGVGGVQGGSDLAHDADRPRRGQGSLAVQGALQIGAVDEPHVDVELPLDLAAAVNGTTCGSCSRPAVRASRNNLSRNAGLCE